MPEKIMSIRFNEKELKKIEILKDILEKEYCINYNNTLLIKYCVNRTFAEISDPETWTDNKITG